MNVYYEKARMNLAALHEIAATRRFYSSTSTHTDTHSVTITRDEKMI